MHLVGKLGQVLFVQWLLFLTMAHLAEAKRAMAQLRKLILHHEMCSVQSHVIVAQVHVEIIVSRVET